MPAWWVPAADAQTMTVRLAELAACVGARSGEVAAVKAGQRDAADLLWHYLEQRAPWLLVIDGADDPGAVTGLLRRTQTGLVVVTSRVSDRAAWGRHTELHTLGPLDPAAGGQVLVDLGVSLEPTALAERLGGLPLALRQVGSQLAAGLVAAADVENLQERAIVAATREMGLEALAAAGVAQARALLRVFGFLAAGVVIPAAMIDLEVLASVAGGAAPAEEGLRALAAAGLITTIPAGMIVHSLVSEASRVFTGDAARAGGVAVGMLTAAAATLEGTKTNWPAWAALQPHVSAVYGYLGGVLGEADLANLTRLAGTSAAAFLNSGWATVAAELATAALRHARGWAPSIPASCSCAAWRSARKTAPRTRSRRENCATCSTPSCASSGPSTRTRWAPGTSSPGCWLGRASTSGPNGGCVSSSPVIRAPSEPIIPARSPPGTTSASCSRSAVSTPKRRASSANCSRPGPGCSGPNTATRASPAGGWRIWRPRMPRSVPDNAFRPFPPFVIAGYRGRRRGRRR